MCVGGWGIMPQSMWMSEDNYGAARSLLSRVPEIELWLAGSAANVFTHRASHWPQGLRQSLTISLTEFQT